jgi:N-acetylglutamate synthase-like GNAT family acetyltransferase
VTHSLPEGYAITTDPARIDVDVVHRYLSETSYWARHIPRELVQRSIDNSLNFAVLAPDGRQVGFARVVTDKAAFAWLADVFILPDEAGRGLGKALMAAIVAHPDLQGLRRFALGTRDAHGLYAQFGFTPLTAPDWQMEIYRPAMYPAGTS